ncbi:MAG: antitoxin VapB family protein [Thermoplasmata archaeon]
MGSKTISITEEAYHRLRARKRRGESFTDVVLRLTERRPLTEFAGILDEETGRALAEAVEEARKERASVDVSR